MIEDQRSDNMSRERIAVLETQLRTICQQHKEMQVDIKQILATLSEASGGWKMLMLVGGAGGTVGALLSKLVGHFTFQ